MLTRQLRKQFALLTGTVILLFSGAAYSSDHTNTDEELPIQVEDAYPIEYRSVELQFLTRYEDIDSGNDRFVIKPEITAGLLRNTEFRVEGNFLTNKDDEDNTAELALLYNFNTETLSTPAFALVGKAEFDFNGGTDFTARGIITKSCGSNRFNLNLDYIDAGDPGPNERSSRYLLGLGWDKSLNLYTLLLADIFTERSRLEGEDAEVMAEIGLRYQLDPNTVLSGGLGAGLAGGSGGRDFTATIGFSRSF